MRVLQQNSRAVPEVDTQGSVASVRKTWNTLFCCYLTVWKQKTGHLPRQRENQQRTVPVLRRVTSIESTVSLHSQPTNSHSQDIATAQTALGQLSVTTRGPAHKQCSNLKWLLGGGAQTPRPKGFCIHTCPPLHNRRIIQDNPRPIAVGANEQPNSLPPKTNEPW